MFKDSDVEMDLPRSRAPPKTPTIPKTPNVSKTPTVLRTPQIPQTPNTAKTPQRSILKVIYTVHLGTHIFACAWKHFVLL